MKSLWRSTVELPHFDKLTQDKSTSVLIIGGGAVGLLCAYHLKKSGVECVLLEANEICGGTTGNTTAKITAQHGLIYDKLIRDAGEEKAKLYLEANLNAVEEYAKLCSNIDCSFKRENAYVYAVNNTEPLYSEIQAIQKLGYNAVYKKNLDLPFSIAGAICFENQAQFDPLKFFAQIAKDLPIYEHTQVLDVNDGVAYTDNAKVKFEKVISATHFPFIDRHGSYFLKQYQSRSYAIAYENMDFPDGMYIDMVKNNLSFRKSDNLTLVGGGGHRTGKKGEKWEAITAFQKEYYPNAKEKCRWATQDCMSLDSIPYIGNYSASTPNWFVATGFNKWGMTGSMVASKILSDMVQSNENEYSEIFSTSRSILKKQLAVNVFETFVNFIYPTTKRCSHLGCSLKWNPAEHSWDCACHGSRFDEDGEILNNPANRTLHNNK